MRTKTSLKFHWVDVFATQALGGNPLPVVLDADVLDERTMKLVAREFNQAETTFVLAPSRAGVTYRLRSFTAAGHEVFGAGHNALGAWLVLAAAGCVKADAPSVVCHQELGQDVLPVEITFRGREVQRVVMKQAPPTFGAVVSDAPTLASALGLDVSDIDLARFPAQVVSTGAAHCLVPIRDRRAIDRARPDAERLLAILGKATAKGVTSSRSTPSIPRRPPMRASSIRPWASTKTRQPGPRPVPCRRSSSPRVSFRMAPRSSSNKVTRWDDRAGSSFA